MICGQIWTMTMTLFVFVKHRVYESLRHFVAVFGNRYIHRIRDQRSTCVWDSAQCLNVCSRQKRWTGRGSSTWEGSMLIWLARSQNLLVVGVSTFAMETKRFSVGFLGVNGHLVGRINGFVNWQEASILILLMFWNLNFIALIPFLWVTIALE